MKMFWHVFEQMKTGSWKTARWRKGLGGRAPSLAEVTHTKQNDVTVCGFVCDCPSQFIKNAWEHRNFPINVKYGEEYLHWFKFKIYVNLHQSLCLSTVTLRVLFWLDAGQNTNTERWNFECWIFTALFYGSCFQFRRSSSWIVRKENTSLSFPWPVWKLGDGNFWVKIGSALDQSEIKFSFFSSCYCVQ